MSRRTVLRFALAALLAATLASPVVAQVSEAPMPRAKVVVCAEEEVFQIEVGSGPVLFGRAAVPAPPLCGFDRCPPVPENGPDVNWSCVEISRLCPVARPIAGFPHPLAGVTTVRWDESCGGWWVETVRLPQPRVACPAVVGVFGTCPPSRDVVVAAPRPGAMVGAAIGSATGLSAPPTCCEKAGKLAGTWYREVEGMVFSATFAGDEMKLCMTRCEDGQVLCFTFTADYAITKEGLVHGVITGVDVEVKRDTKPGGMCVLPPAELAAELQQLLVDCPFSFRTKVTSAGVMVSNLKVAAEDFDKDDLAVVCGMYKCAADGKVPVARPVKTTGGARSCEAPACRTPDVRVTTGLLPDLVEPAAYSAPSTVPSMPTPTPPGTPVPMMTPPAPPGEVVSPEDAARQLVKILGSKAGCTAGMTLPSPKYLEHCPQYLPPPIATPVQPWVPERMTGRHNRPGDLLPVMPPVAVAAPPARLAPPVPANVPPGDFGMMAQVFGQMMEPMPPGTRLPGSPQCYAPTQPPPGVVQPLGYVAPPAPPAVPPPPVVYAAPRALPAPPQPSVMIRPLTGTWVREVGPIVYVIKIAGDHVTITMTAAAEFAEGKVGTEGMTITADYQMMRDGTTMLGLVTGVDAILEGDVPPISDLPVLADELERVQKVLADKPLAMSLRVYGETLVVGNVRVPELDHPYRISPMSGIGGRYKWNGDKPLPKPKPTKVNELPTYSAAEHFRPRPYAPPAPYGLPSCPNGGCGQLGVPFWGYPAYPVFPPGYAPPPPSAVAPPPSGAVPRELNAVTLPPIPGDIALPAPTEPADRILPPAVRVPESAPPVPMMPTPTPPVVEQPKEKKKGKKKVAPVLLNVYSSDPVIRIQNLLNESEDLRTIQNEWRRFWFNDQLGRLTPERIHGGILW
jgi:hypothetical protein